MYHRCLRRLAAGIVSLLAMVVLSGPARAIIQSTSMCQASGGLPDNGYGMPNSDCLSQGTTVVGSTPFDTRAAGVAWNLGFSFQVNGDVQAGGYVQTAIGGGFEAPVFAYVPPPVPVTEIPLIVIGDFTPSLGGVPPGGFSSGEITLEAYRLTGSGFPVLNETDSLAFDVDNPPATNVLELPYGFLLDGSLNSNLQFGGSATCVTSAQPGDDADCGLQLSFDVVFDQDTFDQQMGANSFPLDQYFLIIPLPEPGAGPMLAGGVCVLLTLGRRRARGVRRP